jgi:hypothetical protein
MAEQASNPTVLRFDQRVDQDIRGQAKKVHKLTATINKAGFPIRTLCGTIRNRDILEQFKLKPDNNLSMIEFVNKGEEVNSQITDWINANTKAKIINQGIYTYNNGHTAFRVVLDCTNI